MTPSLNFWSFAGRIGRGTYVVVGFVAFAVKHNLDRLLAQSQKVPWSPWNYWIPFGEMFRGVPSGPKEQELAKTLFFCGVAVSVDRHHVYGEETAGCGTASVAGDSGACAD